ncbi:MAG: amylo-alpha-1,6-glucosidase [Dehalococcoidia bacterium]|nr:amylo-alpha-1,6-glucosidase [Dehalococcoidia bacterium]
MDNDDDGNNHGREKGPSREGKKSRTDRPGHGAGKGPGSAKERRVLQHGASTLAGAPGPSLTAKQGAVFAYSASDGDIDCGRHAGYGLYFHDMRYLDHATLRLNRSRLAVLLSNDEAGDRAVCELTNGDLRVDDVLLPKETLSVRRERRVARKVTETITVRNFHSQAVSVEVELAYGSHFDDMFVVRGADVGERGTVHEPTWRNGKLVLRYDGADGRTRTTTIGFEPGPSERDRGCGRFQLDLESGKEAEIRATIALRDEGPAPLEDVPAGGQRDAAQFRQVRVEADNPLFQAVLDRSFTDLGMLVTEELDVQFFAAGVPWYVALFGRDTLITALQTLPFDPGIAANSLRVLAKYQGTQEDEWRDEEPGKILNELRVGEKAQLHEVAQTPYYGTVDATPLFVILVAEYLRWTDDDALREELRENVERAVRWINEYGDHDGDGFVDYIARSAKGLSNQGWKDSGNSIVHRDGSLAKPPIALVEVQGYVYRAKLAAAWLAERDGDEERARALKEQAMELRERFAKAFWMEDRQFLAAALAQGGNRVGTLMSNAGQALWSGIVAPAHAAAVAATLVDRAMFSGWGVRTLAEGECGYNPIDYQVGSVWPHDNSLIASGLRRYGLDEAFLRVFSGIFQAAAHFPHYRLPEVFSGFSREQYSLPVRYPVACNPQAWAAGSIPLLLQAALGLEPDAAGRRLAVVRPVLPEWLPGLTLRDLRVGEATVTLRFERSSGATLVSVGERAGDIAVEVRY